MKFNAEEANEDLTHKHTYANDKHTYVCHTYDKQEHTYVRDNVSINTLVSPIRDTLEDKDYIRKPMSNLRLVSGGNEPPSTTGNWLLDLPIGTRFAVSKRPTREEPNNPMCVDLELMNKTNKTVLLFELSSGSPFGGGSGRFVANKFTQIFEKVEILPSYEEMITEALQKEGVDNDGNRTHQLEAGRSTGDVDHDAGIEGQPKIPS